MEKKSPWKITAVIGSREWTLTGFWAALVAIVLFVLLCEGVGVVLLSVVRAVSGAAGA